MLKLKVYFPNKAIIIILKAKGHDPEYAKEHEELGTSFNAAVGNCCSNIKFIIY